MRKEILGLSLACTLPACTYTNNDPNDVINMINAMCSENALVANDLEPRISNNVDIYGDPSEAMQCLRDAQNTLNEQISQCVVFFEEDPQNPSLEVNCDPFPRLHFK